MSAHAILKTMKLKGKVKDGVVAVDLPDGTEVTVVVEEERGYKLDEHGRLIMTPELEASIAEGEAEADRGEGLSLDEVRAHLDRHR